MSTLLNELEATEALLKHPLVTKELAKAYQRSSDWLRKNAQIFEDVGWSVDVFYKLGHLAFPYSDWGPGWLPLWNSDTCELKVTAKGNLEFVLHEAGGDVVQTYWHQRHFLAS